MISGEARRYLADFISTNTRRELGRGPVGVKVGASGDLVIVEIHGFMTPLERVLVKHGRNHEWVVRIRQLLVENLASVWEEAFNNVGLSVKEVTSEVDVKQNKQTITFRVAELNTMVGP